MPLRQNPIRKRRNREREAFPRLSHSPALRSQRGQATVELGVSLIVMVVLFLGLVDVGYLLSHTITLENAARQGMRVGIMGYSDAHIVTAVQNATTTLEASRLNWNILPADGETGRASGGILAVELWYEDRAPLPLRGLFDNPYTLHVCRKGQIQ